MKKISLVFLILLSGLLSSPKAQPTSVTAYAHTTDPVLVSSIREYNYPATICCNIYDTTTGHYLISFSYQDSVSMQTRKVSLWNYIINDFKVSNDSVFFCGHNTEGHGIIGFFDIQDLFFNNGNYYIQDVFEVMSHNDVFRVNDFTKLVTYVNNNNERHIVCIGHAFDNSTSSNSGCVVDFFKYMITHKEEDTARPGSPWSYNSGVLYKQHLAGLWNEEDIILTYIQNDTLPSTSPYDFNEAFNAVSAKIKPYEFLLYGGIGNVMEVQRYALRIWPITINCAE